MGSHVNALCLSASGAGALFVGCQDGHVRVVDLRAGLVHPGLWPLAVAAGAALPAVCGLSMGAARGGGEALLVATADTLHVLEPGSLRALPGVSPMRAPGFALASRVSRAVLSPCGSHAVAGSKSGALLCWHAGGAGEFEFAVGGAGAADKQRRRKARGGGGGGGDDALMGGAFAELSAEAPLAEAPPGHSAAATCVAFSPNGELLASGDADGVVCVWH